MLELEGLSNKLRDRIRLSHRRVDELDGCLACEGTGRLRALADPESARPEVFYPCPVCSAGQAAPSVVRRRHGRRERLVDAAIGIAIGLIGGAALGLVLGVARAAEFEPPAFVPPTAPVEPAFEPSAVCPSGAGHYEGSDEAVAAEYASSNEEAEFCRALLAGVGRLRQTTYWGLVESLGSAQVQREGVAYLAELAEAPAAGGGEGAGVVGALASETTAVEESGMNTLQAVYILVGVVLGLFVLSLLWEILRSAG